MDYLSLRAITEILAAIILPPVMLLFYPLFLLWIPLLELSGAWINSVTQLPRELRFVPMYMELIMVGAFFIRWLCGSKDKLSLFLLGLPILAAPSLFNADGHFFFSLFLFILLLCSPGVYGFFLAKMKWFMKINLVDWAVLLWVALGLIAKYYLSLKYGDLMIYQRGGGVWGSNYVGGILLLLLPLVKKPWVLAVGIAFLLIQFSLGIYMALVILAVGWLFVGNHRLVLGILGGAILIVIICISIPGLSQPVLEFLGQRLGTAASQTGTLIAGLSLRISGSDRWQIWGAALEMAYKSGFIGVGFGGFAWGLASIGSDLPLYSNAHNIYLTALAEGGLLFTVGLICLLVFALWRAYSVSKPVFIGLLAWMFYGLYSGEIYEASRGTSAANYYILMFVLAYLSYMRRMQRMQVTNAAQCGMQ